MYSPSKYKQGLSDFSDFSAGSIDRSSYLCAIQYPKYDSDLAAFDIKLVQKMATEGEEWVSDLINYIEETLLLSLDKMHFKGIYHLDIKNKNIGITEDGITKFADWDFTCFEKYNDSVNFCFNRSLESRYIDYYHFLTDEFFDVKKVMNQNLKKKRSMSKDEKISLLRFIDRACLFSTLLTLWENFGTESDTYLEKKQQYLTDMEF